VSGGTGIDVLDDFINVNTQLATAGLVGYGKDGAKAGVTGKPVVKGVKEVTGATAAEEANALARDQFEKSTEDALKNRQNAQLQNQQNQIKASQEAGSSTVRRATTNKTATPLGGTTDFLGL